MTENSGSAPKKPSPKKRAATRSAAKKSASGGTTPAPKKRAASVKAKKTASSLTPAPGMLTPPAPPLKNQIARERSPKTQTEQPTASSVTAKPMLESDARTFSMLLHLSAILLASVGLGFAGPLVFWLMYKARSALVDQHGKQELNLQITLYILAIGGFVFSLATWGFGALVVLPSFIIFAVIALVFQIIAAVAGYKGQYYRYGIAFPILK